MDWGKIILSLVVMGVAYSLGFIISFFCSKKYASKKKNKAGDTCEK